MSFSSEILGEMSTRFNKQYAFTHPGKWTADNIFCGALCKVMNPNLYIKRTNEEPEEFDTEYNIYYDFATTEESVLLYTASFNKEYRADGVPYGSFGLLWRDYGGYIILPWDKNEATRHIVEFMIDDFDEKIIEPMDIAVQNGVTHPWIQMIENFNYVPNEQANYQTHMEVVMFDKATEMARSFLERWCEIYKMTCASMIRIYESYQASRSEMLGIVYVDDETDIDTEWALEFVREHMDGVYYMVRPSTYRGYNIYPVKKTASQIAEEYPGREIERLGVAIYKMPLPKAWYGERPEELCTHYSTLCFADDDGSMCTTEDYDTAIKIAKNIIASYNNTNDKDYILDDLNDDGND